MRRTIYNAQGAKIAMRLRPKGHGFNPIRRLGVREDAKLQLTEVSEKNG